jgi:hypothetical protein
VDHAELLRLAAACPMLMVRNVAEPMATP